MTKFGQLVMGPAGSGKSTYCNTVYEHYAAIGRPVRVINLDPAAESFAYPCAVNICDLVSLDDVVEECELGPNGGLVMAMEYVLEEGLDWLEEEISQFNDDEYFMLDCPGQIELYSHIPVMKDLVDFLTNRLDMRLCGVYCLDVMFISDTPKFISGALSALSVMINIDLPHVNVLTKCDLVASSEDRLEEFLECDTTDLCLKIQEGISDKMKHLTIKMAELLQEYSLVSFTQVDRDDEESIERLLEMVNLAIQYGENLEPEDKDYLPEEEMDGSDEDFVASDVLIIDEFICTATQLGGLQGGSPRGDIISAFGAVVFTMERSIEAGIAELTKISGNAERRESSRIPLDDQVEIVTTLMSSTERQLRELQVVVDEMAAIASEKSRHAQVQRHRGILTDLREHYRGVSKTLHHELRRTTLLSSVEEGRIGKSEIHDDDESNLLRERGGIEASIRAMDEMLSTASDTREKLEQQNNVFVKMKGKLGQIGSTIPGVDGLIRKIRARKRKEQIILGLTLGVCGCLTIWYRFM
ncbi:GPN-loop GTPase 3 [Perkinsus olseni]|uniref:GPN-loop GTPase 3 n=1 Tax=Perkinsus olseni TaxID=32597 RepID=A0A7J6NHV9_PEROL|nr:GPN-loop GTPase 3 [Perkinsus olseni]